jgi:hypothetical protein
MNKSLAISSYMKKSMLNILAQGKFSSDKVHSFLERLTCRLAEFSLITNSREDFDAAATVTPTN